MCGTIDGDCCVFKIAKLKSSDLWPLKLDLAALSSRSAVLPILHVFFAGNSSAVSLIIGGSVSVLCIIEVS